MEIRVLAQQHGAAAIEEAARLMREAESEQVRISAINTLLDRGYGRPCQPKQEFELTSDIRIESLSDHQLEALLRRLDGPSESDRVEGPAAPYTRPASN